MPELADKQVLIVVPCALNDPEVLPKEHFEKGLKYLYGCLRRMPGFHDTKRWNSLPSQDEIVGHLDQLLTETTRRNFKTIFQYQEERKKFVLCTYHELRMQESYVLPLEWLPLLRKRNEVAYHLVLNVLSMVAHAFRLDVFYNQYNDMVIDSPGDYGNEEDELYNQILQLDAMSYQKGGEAFQHAQMIRKLGDLDKEYVARSIAQWKPRVTFERAIKRWLLLGIEALECPRPVSLYVYPDVLEAETGSMPLTCCDHMCYMWSFQDNVFENTDSWMESTGSEFGQCGPMIQTIWYPNCAPKVSASEEPIKRLQKFLMAGRVFYFRNYNQRLVRMREKFEAAIKKEYEEYGELGLPSDNLINILV